MNVGVKRRNERGVLTCASASSLNPVCSVKLSYAGDILFFHPLSVFAVLSPVTPYEEL
jgi:hypothetical protein